MQFESVHPTFGTRVSSVDVRSMDDTTFATLEREFYDKGVMAIGDQTLTPRELADFGSRFGKLYRNPTTPFRVAEVPEIMVLSTRREGGKVVGQARAGESWHTDMCYNRLPGRITMLYGVEVPFRDGEPLGDTKFADMVACYEALPAAIKAEIAGAEAVHDFNLAFERRITYEGKPKMTPEMRALRPAVNHPMVALHPVTGKKMLYINTGFVSEIVGFDAARSRELLDWLFAFQIRPEFIYRHKWRTNDILLWDDLSTLHQATLDYEDHELRHMYRAQVDGDRPLVAA